MAMTIQFHKYEGIPKHDHNVRKIDEAHIRGENEGGFFKILEDCDWKDKVDNDFFKDEIKAFNAKQTRKDRMKVSYYDECKEREQKDEERKIVRLAQGKNDVNVFRPVHELVIGFYGTDIDINEKEKLLIEYVDFFKKEYGSNLKLVGAYIHGDEQKSLINSGKKTLEEIDLHLHLDFTPIAHNFKKGMEKQISLSSALKELGFENKNKKLNSIVDFENKNREILAQLLNKDRQIPIKIIPTSTEKKIHQEKEVFVKTQQLKALNKDIENKKELNENLNFSISEKENINNDLNKIIEEKNMELKLKDNEIINLKKEKIQSQREILSLENELQNLKNEHNFYLNEIENLNKIIKEKDVELQNLQISYNTLESKGDLLFEQLKNANNEMENLHFEKEILDKEIKDLEKIREEKLEEFEEELVEISSDFAISEEQAEEFLNDLHTALLNCTYAGRKIESEGMNDVERNNFIAKTLQKNMENMEKSVEKLEKNNKTLKEKIKERIQSFKDDLERSRIINNPNIVVHLNKDGKVTEQAKEYIYKELYNLMYSKNKEDGYEPVRCYYWELDKEGKEELLHKMTNNVVRNVEKKAEIEHIKFLDKIELQKFIKATKIINQHLTVAGNIASKYMAVQQQIANEYER